MSAPASMDIGYVDTPSGTGLVFPGALPGRAGDAVFLPYVGPHGEVGYQCTHDDGRVEYIYFNLSEPGKDAGPQGRPGFNAFVYQGPTGDPAYDGPQHFYYLFEEEE